MKERRFLPALALAALFAACAHTAVTPGKLEDCSQTKDLSRAIAGCSEAIRNGSKDAQVYVNRGFAYFLKNDYQHAIADYEDAIQLNAKDPKAFDGRGLVFRAKGDDDRAIADFNRALELGSTDPRVFINRAMAHVGKGETEKAIADYGAAIERANGSFDGQIAQLSRGIVYLHDGALDKARADFKRVTELSPKEPFFAIFLYLAERRMGSTDASSAHLKAVLANLDLTKWPAPVIRMFLGEGTTEAVLASNANEVMVCEADFYAAEFVYLQNQKEEALRLYRKAALQDCRRYILEGIAASLALRSLGSRP